MSTVALRRMTTVQLILIFSVAGAIAQAGDHEGAILELGGAAGWNVNGGAASFGPSIGVEVTPVENWLELEVDTTPLFLRHSVEWGTDLLFKKPWTLSKKMEFMAGAGPEWVYSRASGNSLAGEAAVDFMYWPGARHRFGWYVEPSYEYDFGRGHEKSLGIAVGLLIAIP